MIQMRTLLTILFSIIGLVLVFIVGLFMRKTHFVKREIAIAAPQEKVFDFIKLVSENYILTDLSFPMTP